MTEIYFKIKIFNEKLKPMSKRTLSNKTRHSILRLSGFRSRMATAEGRKTISKRRKKGRKSLTLKK